ncbi:DUF3370 domain-containing protein [Roseofilum casamattae]|uniref:DUF3370 domain-containing protein n=1 Tax=Roseofilum casamattae BLCC-M143 TaxID=3022442 RepID=A0ABT7BY47_9CYAN|nr:DUF3370 domain-containing protein [Roseofilum casamattae]MDJ1184081.1 DUF3370 domain-containing protein [Roseofilum casamattae BLCC-M143]
MKPWIFPLTLTSFFFLFQVSLTSVSQPAPQEVRPLPGRLDRTPVFNSNSPEQVLNEGILLSTFPATKKKTPQAHLDFPFQGRFDIFAHHVAKGEAPDRLQTLYLGLLVHNPNPEPVTLQVLEGASYLSLPDAPFVDLPPWVDNQSGNIYAGPGSRVTHDVLEGKRQNSLPSALIIPGGKSKMLLNAPIPVKPFTPPLNGRSTLMRLQSSAPVYVASLAQFAKLDTDGMERTPTLAEWQQILNEGSLAEPRDRAPTAPDRTEGSIIYGRVAGVAQGSRWEANLTDTPESDRLTIPQAGKRISYGISTLRGGRLGTGQIQTAPMLVRYPDTAYAAHGNYAVEYQLTLPLYNPQRESQTVAISLQSPLKADVLGEQGLQFDNSAAAPVVFRGTVRVQFVDRDGAEQTRKVHLVQRRGDESQPLTDIDIPPGITQTMTVNLLYPPDATPPQVLTIHTLDD